MEKLAKVIGVGKNGIRIAQQFPDHGFSGKTHYSTLAISVSKKDLELTTIERKIQLDTECCLKTMTNDEVTNGRMILENNVSTVTKNIGRSEYVLIVADFGCGISAGIASQLANVLDNLGINAFCLVIKPPKSAGGNALGNYLEGTTFLTTQLTAYFEFVIADSPYNTARSRIPSNKGFDLVQQEIIKKIYALFEF